MIEGVKMKNVADRNLNNTDFLLNFCKFVILNEVPKKLPFF